MQEIACLDTGPIHLFFMKDCPEPIDSLIKKVQRREIMAFVAAPVLLEVFKHLCVGKGREYAESCLQTFQSKIPATITPLDIPLIFRAGSLKCQYREELSYIDCTAIALAIRERAILHTTEKELPKIKGLKTKVYNFD
ncbi:MAG TPA: PIN domain-containing protein [Candidatus Lokiarchaeia archaeon]|nr:PIN domain-containing protein [Candidatus Lokiarchaeia archaeon]